MKKSLIISLILVVVISLLATSRTMDHTNPLEVIPEKVEPEEQERAVVDLPGFRNLLMDYDYFLTHTLEDESVPGMAVAVVKDTNLIFQKLMGVKDIESLEAIDQHTVFRIASLSKGFAPVLTGMLVEDSILTWEDKVVDHYPELRLKSRRHTNKLNLLHIMSHTTGLPRHSYSHLLNKGISYDSILTLLHKVKLYHRPGKYYNYQNVAYSLIGNVVEAATEKEYEELLQERIFNPLGMKDASASYFGFATHDNIAYPHMPDRNGSERIDLAKNWYEVIPAAGVNASISDMTEWLQLLLGNRPDLISMETLDRIFEPFIWMSTRESVFSGYDDIKKAWYALGWRVVQTKDRTIVCHSGFVNGFRAEIAFDREEKVGVVMLSNGYSSVLKDVIPKLFKLLNKEGRLPS